ncbi:carboxylesterase/lipase family protein [Nocardiopsis dassonvillei]|uniref:carboxylesterase/lipase family protein n=1 Tax=Nocardiopsis dassonvillei TaxID=2014 RepID=UPI0036FF6EB8
MPRSFTRAAATALAAALLFTAGAGPATAQPREPAEPTGRPTVTTASGPVTGVRENGLEAFRGIPFAEPPVGENRFLPPQPVQSWSEPLDAAEFGAACPQRPSEQELGEGEPTSEDCLTLNVWSRDTSGSDPVIVFIHGGGFTSGTARNAWYDGADLAAAGATVVSIQYRLGPLGWLDLSEAGPDYAQSMNNGLLDQMEALRWVRENIAAFGGDPDNVTVSGESAGAISISALMGIEEADGLYDRAILQSGTSGTVATADWSRDVATTFTEAAGVESASDVLDLDTDRMLDAADEVYASQFADTAFHPVVDGDLLPGLPYERLASSDGPTAPVVIGTTLDEARYWLYLLPELDRLPRMYFDPWLESLVGERSQEVIDAYLQERPELTDAQLGMAMAGDVSFRMPAIRMAEALAERGVDVRMYLATVPAIDLGGRMGSPHAVELPFMFGTLEAADTFVGDTADNRALSEQVQDLWVGFARDGDPATSGTRWPLYDTQERSTLMLDHDLRVEQDPYPAARQAWGDMAFDGTEPGLDRLTPLQYEGSNPHHPLVIASVIGWGKVWGALVLLVVLTGTAVVLVRRGRGRTRPAG